MQCIANCSIPKAHVLHALTDRHLVYMCHTGVVKTPVKYTFVMLKCMHSIIYLCCQITCIIYICVVKTHVRYTFVLSKHLYNIHLCCQNTCKIYICLVKTHVRYTFVLSKHM